MKYLTLSLLFACIAFVHPATAGEKPSCDDLTELADGLDEVAEAYAEAGTITEGDDVDQALGELVDLLDAVADIEGEEALGDAVDALAEAYDGMDGDKFGLSLDSVIVNLDRLHRRDCD